MSPKLKYHQIWNFTKTEVSPKLNCHQNWTGRILVQVDRGELAQDGGDERLISDGGLFEKLTNDMVDIQFPTKTV